MEMKTKKRGLFAVLGIVTLFAMTEYSVSIAATSSVEAVANKIEASKNKKSADGELLLAAVKAQRVETVKSLVQGGVDVNSVVEGDGTALILAAKAGDAKMVDELIKLGANVNLKSDGDGNPLIAAAKTGNLDIVKKLIAAGAKVNTVVPGDETPLINASRAGETEVVKYLVANGADVNLGSVERSNGRDQLRTPLNQAGNGDIKQFLKSKGAKQ